MSARLVLHDSPVVAGRFVLDHRADGDRDAVGPRRSGSAVVGAVGDHDDERLGNVPDGGCFGVLERGFCVDLHTAAVSDVGVGDRELGVERFALMVERTRNAPVVRYGADDIDVEIVSVSPVGLDVEKVIDGLAQAGFVVTVLGRHVVDREPVAHEHQIDVALGGLLYGDDLFIPVEIGDSRLDDRQRVAQRGIGIRALDDDERRARQFRLVAADLEAQFLGRSGFRLDAGNPCRFLLLDFDPVLRVALELG